MNSRSSRPYWIVWLALLGLLFLTWLAATVNMGPLNVVVAMTIAISKMLLVMVFFMHLRATRPLTWVFASAGFLWLLILLGLTLSDYLTRQT